MLKHLSIKDFAVVRQTELEFGPGMTVVSGETGAGKSLMVDALTLLAGARADSGMVRHGSERAELAAEFQLSGASPALEWLRSNELDEDSSHCQLRRVIRADGGSRAWINGRPATISQLSELASFLVEVHGQHDQQALMARSSQLNLLDAYARNGEQRRQVRQAAQHGRPCWTRPRRCRHVAMSATGLTGCSTSLMNWTARTSTCSPLNSSPSATAARPMPAPWPAPANGPRG
jgi:ATPase involved in DNA repair